MLEVRFQVRLIQSCETESVASKIDNKLTNIAITPLFSKDNFYAC